MESKFFIKSKKQYGTHTLLEIKVKGLSFETLGQK